MKKEEEDEKKEESYASGVHRVCVRIMRCHLLFKPRSKTRLFRPAVPMSLTLLGFGSPMALPPPCSRPAPLILACCCLLASPRTSSTHASLSGLIESRLERGFGPARPRGVEYVEEYGLSPKELFDETDRRRPNDAAERGERGERDDGDSADRSAGSGVCAVRRIF